MGKRSRTKARDHAASPGAVGPRQPCPCGSGRRYKACHGSADGPAAVFVNRPFEGLPGECDVVAMRELVQSATAPLTLADDHERRIRLSTLLPMAAPGMVRESGDIWLGLQVRHNFGDPARDLGAVLVRALESEPGIVGLTDPPGGGPRLQDLVAGTTLDVTVHEGFEHWLDDQADTSGMAAALDQANASVNPTARLTSVDAAYWTNVGPKEHLRWVMPEQEDRLLDALARLHTGGRDSLVPDGRFVGMFRAHGLLTPVWDLPVGTGAAALEEPAARFADVLAEALSDDSPLSADQRAARSGLANRQVTIR
jgi:Family of unknown function (DUF5926)/SEC-C motif